MSVLQGQQKHEECVSFCSFRARGLILAGDVPFFSPCGERGKWGGRPRPWGLVIRSSVIRSLSVFGMETDGAGVAKRYPQGVGWAVCGMDADGLILKILQKNMEKCCVT